MNAHSPEAYPPPATASVVISGREVARLLGYKSENSFYNRRLGLERDHGFPPKLPGLNGWSRPCVLRWVETNGETWRPEPPEPQISGSIEIAARQLEQDYGGRA